MLQVTDTSIPGIIPGVCQNLPGLLGFSLGWISLKKNFVENSLTVYRVFLFAAGDSHYAKGQSANIHSKSMLVPLSFSDAVEPIREQGMS